LVPSVQELLAAPPKDPAVLSDLMTLLPLVPPPTDAAPLAAWNAARAQIKTNARLEKVFVAHDGSAHRQRANPPSSLKSGNFCGVAESPAQ
jgi:hypothetical protein